MQTKNQFLDYIQQVKSILNADDVKPLGIQDRGLFNDIQDETGKIEKSLETQITEAELIVPVVGGFSAGKSTLINTFLEREVLAVDMSAETALATELRYNVMEYIEAIDTNSKVIKYELSQLKEIKDNAQNYKFLRIFLNNKNLKEIQPLVLVDMPGFGATNENHDKAIKQYLYKGNYFVFLNSATEDSTIKSDMAQQIRKICDIGKGFSFCLSKTDLVPEDDINSLKVEMKEQLEDLIELNDDIEILAVSQNDIKVLDNVLKDINPEELFRKVFIDSLKNNNTNIKNDISLKISTFNTEKGDIEKAINSLVNDINKIEEEQKKQIEQIEKRYSKNSVNNIINFVCSNLRSRTSYLANIAISNSSQFRSEIEDIIRSTSQTQLMEEFKKIVDQILNELTVTLESSNINIDGLTIDSSFLTEFNRQIEDMMKKTDNSVDFDKVINEATGILGLLLKIISPLLSTIISFIPTSLLSMIFGSENDSRKNEQDAKNKVGLLICERIIPEIETQLLSKLPETLNYQVRNVIEKINLEYRKQINQRINTIKDTQGQKEKDSEIVQSNINTLIKISKEIELLVKQL